MNRFFSKVDKTSYCWLWRGTIDHGGYGIFYSNGPIKAHRHSYELHFSKIAAGKFICHTCDIRNCVNPKHLFEGTALDNNRDKMRKGRCSRVHFYGEVNPMAKISRREALEIREIYAFGGSSQRLIGEAYGLTQQTISSIIKGDLWQTLNGL